MKIMTLMACEAPLPSGATLKLPSGWSGDVADGIGEHLIKSGVAQAEDNAQTVPVTLTPEETAVLKVAAGQIIAETTAAKQPTKARKGAKS